MSFEPSSGPRPISAGEAYASFAPIGGSFFSASAQLDDAQIKTITSTHINLVDALGDSTILVPLWFHYYTDTTNGAYTNFLGAGVGRLGYGIDHASFGEILSDDSGLYSLLGISGIKVKTISDISGAASSATEQAINQPISFEFDYGSADLQDGGSGNSLQIGVCYQVINL